MRIGELEALTWGDVDEPRGRWRIATSKTGRPRWVDTASPLLLAAFSTSARAMTADPTAGSSSKSRASASVPRMTRACTAAGVPAFSPHDLRHRRVSLLHLGGMPWARIGELVGHDDLITTARTYTHVVADERELDYAEAARLTSAGWRKLLKLVANRLHLLPVLLVHREPPYLVAELRAIPPALASGRFPIA